MTEKSRQPILALDAESTLINGECLDLLGLVVGGEQLQRKIETLTHQAMSDGWDFRQSLEARVGALVGAGMHKGHLAEVAGMLRPAPSVERHKQWFADNPSAFLVVSGGFVQCIDPVLRELGIPRNRRYANRFTIDKETGRVTGFDIRNVLSTDGGKARLLGRRFEPEAVVAVGDGSNDLSIKLAGAAATFLAFTEVAYRRPVAHHPETDLTVNDFGLVIDYFQGQFPVGLYDMPENTLSQAC